MMHPSWKTVWGEPCSGWFFCFIDERGRGLNCEIPAIGMVDTGPANAKIVWVVGVNLISPQTSINNVRNRLGRRR